MISLMVNSTSSGLRYQAVRMNKLFVLFCLFCYLFLFLHLCFFISSKPWINFSELLMTLPSWSMTTTGKVIIFLLFHNLFVSYFIFLSQLFFFYSWVKWACNIYHGAFSFFFHRQYNIWSRMPPKNNYFLYKIRTLKLTKFRTHNFQQLLFNRLLQIYDQKHLFAEWIFNAVRYIFQRILYLGKFASLF